MEYSFQERDDFQPINSPRIEKDEINFALIDTPGAHDHGQRTFSRKVVGEVIEQTGDSVVVEIEVSDNVNGGFFGMADIGMDGPGGTKVTYEKRLEIDQDEVERRQEDGLVRRSMTQAVLPDVKEWAKEAEFRAETEPFPENPEL